MHPCLIASPKSFNGITKHAVALCLALLSATVVMSSRGGPLPHGANLPTGDIPKETAASWLMDLMPSAPPHKAAPLISAPPISASPISALTKETSSVAPSILKDIRDSNPLFPLAWDDERTSTNPPSVPQSLRQNPMQSLNWEYYSSMSKNGVTDPSRFKSLAYIRESSQSRTWEALDLRSTNPALRVAVECSYNFHASITKQQMHTAAAFFHPSVTRTIETFAFIQLRNKDDPSTARPVVCYVREFVQGQSLAEYVHENRLSSHLWHPIARKILWQILSILTSLQTHKIPAFAIKMDIFSINKNGRVGLTNFEPAADNRRLSSPQSPYPMYTGGIHAFRILLRMIFTDETFEMAKYNEQSVGHVRNIADALLVQLHGNDDIQRLYMSMREPNCEQLTFAQLLADPYFTELALLPMTPIAPLPAVTQARGASFKTTTQKTLPAPSSRGKRPGDELEHKQKRSRMGGKPAPLQVGTSPERVPERSSSPPVPLTPFPDNGI